MIAPFRFDHVTFARLRRARRKSHRQVGEAAGRPMSWARKLARGERCPTWGEVDAIAELLGLSSSVALTKATEDPSLKEIVDEDESETRRANGEVGPRSHKEALAVGDAKLAQHDLDESLADEIADEVEHLEHHEPPPPPPWLAAVQAARNVEGSP